MTRFVYKAIAADGASVAGDMEAEDERAVVEQLQERGLFPIETRAAERHSRAQRGGLGNEDILHFSRELATMLNAGLALDEALATLARLNSKAGARRTIEALRAGVEAGKPLSVVLGESDSAFSPFYVSLVRAGEATGSVEASLFRLTEFLERKSALSRAVISAVAYPAVLMAVSAASLAVLLLFVVPRFEPMFADLGQALPWSTALVVALAVTLKNYWPVLVVLAFLLPLLVRQLLSDPGRKRLWDGWRLRLPVVGELAVRLEVARLSRTLGLLLRDGVPLLGAIDIVRDSLENLALRQVMGTVRDSLEQGRGLAPPLNACGFFPELALQLIEVGERTSSLPAMLMKLADIYDEQARASLNRVLTILEPALILSMGLAVGFIIVAILLAILGLNDLVL